MNGYTKIANTALFDTRLTLQERAVYAMLLHLIWLDRPERNESDVLGRPMPLPSTPEIAKMLAISDKMFRRYLNRLRKYGYVKTERPSRREPLLYSVFASPSSPVLGDRTQSPESGTPWGDYARATMTEDLEYGKSEDGPYGTPLSRRGEATIAVPESVPWEDIGDPPAIVKDDYGRFAAVDALARLCGITSPVSPRYKEIATALHGRKRNLLGEPGINRLFWLETSIHFGLSLVEVRARAEANPVKYQDALVQVIERRARLYREKMGDAALTPTALAKWWPDLEQLPVRGRKGGMTSDEIRSFRG